MNITVKVISFIKQKTLHNCARFFVEMLLYCLQQFIYFIFYLRLRICNIDAAISCTVQVSDTIGDATCTADGYIQQFYLALNCIFIKPACAFSSGLLTLVITYML